ncbi:MAG: serine hydrolase domain-containing protein [Pyrinomonadaceae bacterium]
MKEKTFLIGFLMVLILGFNAFAAGTAEKIGNLLAESYKKGEYSGALIVARGEKIIYRGAIGLAQREWTVPNTAATRFRINSITKQFTALLIMRLVEEGKISLDGRISDYLPDFPKATGEKVTVKNLLMNASGLPLLEDIAFYRTADPRFADPGYVIKNYLSGGLISEPGARFNYNNGDFIILGAIIERVSGKSFRQVLEEKILKPLGMKNTGLVESQAVIENLADGYVFRDDKFYREPFFSIENYGAAGAMYSTLDDMFLWNKALIGNKLLSKESTAKMFTPAPELGFVGLGSWVYDLKLKDGKTYKIIERQGGIGGFSSLNLFAPEAELSVIFLGNVGTETLFRTYAGQGLSYQVISAAVED